jgi:hypothetical protein
MQYTSFTQYYGKYKNYEKFGKKETNIEYYFPLFLEALVSIIVFYTVFTIYLKFIYPSYTETLCKNDINTQVDLYDLCNISSRSDLSRTYAKNDVGYLQGEVDNINKNYNNYVSKMNTKYTNSINKLVIFTTVIIGVLILGTILFCFLGFYNWRDINFKGLLLAFVLHLCFIVGLEGFLLLVVIPNYGNVSLVNIFYNKE